MQEEVKSSRFGCTEGITITVAADSTKSRFTNCLNTFSN